MKRIKFSLTPLNDKFSLITEEKLYSWHLPNGAFITFGEKRKFQSFVISSEHMYTRMIYEQNEIYAQIQYEYRQIYFNLNTHDETIFENIFLEIRNKMSKCFKLCTIGSNGLSFTYNNSLLIINDLLKALGLLDKIYKKHRNYQKTYKNQFVKERLESHQKKLKIWGWEHHKPWGKFKEINISKYENDYFKAYPIY